MALTGFLITKDRVFDNETLLIDERHKSEQK